jgi:hypothetical protein
MGTFLFYANVFANQASQEKQECPHNSGANKGQKKAATRKRAAAFHK